MTHVGRLCQPCIILTYLRQRWPTNGLSALVLELWPKHPVPHEAHRWSDAPSSIKLGSVTKSVNSYSGGGSSSGQDVTLAFTASSVIKKSGNGTSFKYLQSHLTGEKQRGDEVICGKNIYLCCITRLQQGSIVYLWFNRCLIKYTGYTEGHSK